jgi:hypothetical protein
MPQWRMKRMALSEWAQFQQLFAEFQLLYGDGDPDLALFVKSGRGSEADEVYITGPKLDVIERLSPGGWADSGSPSGEGVLLLAGAADCWARLGIQRQSPDGS